MPREFDYDSLTYTNRLDIHNALAETTLKHIVRSNGLFESMNFDPAASPSQMLETVHLGPVPATFEDQEGSFGIRTLATVAGPNLYPLVRETLERQRAFTSAARLLLDQHTHIFPVTNHGNIADVAIWSAGWAEALESDHWQEQNGLIISRGVTTIKAFEMAASEVVQKIGHAFMSFPRTRTIDELGFDRSLVDTNNRNMRSHVNRWLGEDLIHKFRKNVLGKSLHIAWSGKTDEITYGDDHRPESIRMGKIGKGTLDIVRRGLVLPVTIWDGDDPILELGELTRVDNEADARRVQAWQGRTLAAALGLKTEAVTIED
jgi:hypothetical protein